ncbi:MAG: helix-turn-helix domain-containing protein [Anaerolineales bacterium]|nr:helix-turn-helix domain-containing protein [Anaerolineales bacterium]
MAEGRMNLMTAKEAARYLRISLFTLSKMERDGGLVPYRTPGGHRRYSLRMLNEYLNSSRQRKEVGKWQIKGQAS